MYARNRSGTRLHNPERDENFCILKIIVNRVYLRTHKRSESYCNCIQCQLKREGAGADCYYDVNLKANFSAIKNDDIQPVPWGSGYN